MSQTSDIYLVMGDTGEYSDHKEWVVCAYTNESDAIQRVAFLEATAAKCIGADVYNNWKGREAAKKTIREMDNGDPGACIDYTGIRWWHQKITLHDSF